ncbi:MAG: response regulator [Eubacteriales bacterium]|nr:response regulator [Eubacteriales bacterium]
MSYKVVIVEDNPATVRSLVKTIRWDQLDCTVAATATDGESGRKTLLTCRPDILLTDIRMPRLNGLEMVEAVRQELPDCKVIIITGYDQFQYASQAIKLAAFDYLLKPIQNEEVERSIRRAVSTLNAQRQNDSTLEQAMDLKRRTHLLLLLTNDSQRGQGVSELLGEAGMDFQTYYIMMMQAPTGEVSMPGLLTRLEALYRELHISVVLLLLYDSIIAFVMRQDDGDAWREQAENAAADILHKTGLPLRIGVSSLGTSRHRIRQIYHQARQALWEIALNHDEGQLRFYQEEPSKQAGGRLAGLQSQVDRLVTNADLSDEYAEQAATVLAEQSGNQYSNLRALITLYSLELTKKYHCPHEEALESALCSTWFVSSGEDARHCLVRLSQAMRNAKDGDQSAKQSLLTRNALQYIRLHALEGLRLDDAAEKLCVSANYLSALIRKETGTTFHDHVLEAKMNVARTMLADPRILVEEVSRAVGYNNYVSFYNAFKRIEHMTPTEYRNLKVGL